MSRSHMLAWLDRVVACFLATVLCGTVVSFGGQVWWYPFALACGLWALVCAMLGRAWCSGSLSVLRSPLFLLGICVVGLGLIQIVPWPARLVAGISPRASGSIERLTAEVTRVVRDDPNTLPESTGALVLSADRSATLRWAMGAIACLAVFWSVGHYSDRLARLKIVWGSLAAGFGICTALVILQLACGAHGAFGLWSPTHGPDWAASEADVRAGPALVRLRLVSQSAHDSKSWLIAHTDVPFAMGPLVAGAGAYLALASLVMPLLAGMILDRLAPRGSSEPLRQRLRHQGGIAPLALLVAFAAAGAGLVGYFGGLVLGCAIVLGVIVACLLSMPKAGVSRAALATACGVLAFLSIGIVMAQGLGRVRGSPWIADSTRWFELRGLWADALNLGRAFPVCGVGLGGFAAVQPYLKGEDITSTTAQSSILQWWAETGFPGLAILIIGSLWVLYRLPGAWCCVGTADRPLAGALVGSMVGFVVFSALHWSIQLPAVALAATAVFALADRWLAGGTDLFVDAGDVAPTYSHSRPT